MAVGLVCLGLAVTSVSLYYLWSHRPGLLLKVVFRLFLLRTGVRLKFVQGKKYRYCYGQRGVRKAGEASFVLVHGFSASKDMYTNLLQRLPRDRHIVVVDLPGHGDSTIPLSHDDISLPLLVEHLHELLSLIGMDQEPFHIIGTSMGGAICALYTSNYPNQVAKLTLMCPAMKTPVKTEFMRRMDEGSPDCVLLPSTPQGIHDMLQACIFQKHKVPVNAKFHKGILQLRQPKHAFHKRLFDSIAEESKNDEYFVEQIKTISAPVQVIWGKNDELIHVSGAGQLRELMSTVERVDLLDDCGHSILMDQPDSATKLLLEFADSTKPMKTH